jgi:predicted DNA-binding transcriptional regulator YafY
MSVPRNVGLVRALRMAELLRKERQTVHQLAATFEVTTRTVRRDLHALALAGLAIKSEPCQGAATHYSVEASR